MDLKIVFESESNPEGSRIIYHNEDEAIEEAIKNNCIVAYY